jgi:hypothetical protein
MSLDRTACQLKHWAFTVAGDQLQGLGGGLLSTAIGSLRSGGAIKVNVIETDWHPVITDKAK